MARRRMVTVGALLLHVSCSSSQDEPSPNATAAGGALAELSSGGSTAEEDGGSGAANESGGGSGGTLASGGQTSGGAATNDGGALLSSGGDSPSSGGDNSVGGSESTGGSGGSEGGDATKSPGCGQAPGLSSGRLDLDVAGTARQYVLKVPDNYDLNTAYRLIFGFHGRAYDADWVANGEEPLTGPYFGIEAEAEGGAIFVAPQALSTSWSNEGGRDIDYVQAMVGEITSALCVDEERIFATGFSYGAIMTVGIGCELAGTFRAIAPMSGSLQNGCPDSAEQVGYWASHGTLDTTIAPAQGEAARDEFIARNHCNAETTPSTPEGCVSFKGCDADAPVSWCTFEGEHVPAPFAGTAIWEFFSQF